MKLVFSLLGILFLSANLALAGSVAGGAVSGGGGGTTNPDPVTPLDVESAIYGTYGHGGALIAAWFNDQQKFFDMEGDGQKLSEFYKIFKSDKTVVEVLKNTSIEVRMTKPCLDADGSERDGSIYGSMKGAICISAFSMAPKLNQYNVREETWALIVHEISHLFGTTEDEAVKIQQQALWSFKKLDFIDVSIALRGLYDANFGNMFPLQADFMLAETLSEEGVADLMNDMERIREDLNFNGRSLGGSLLFVSPHTLKLATTEFSRLDAVKDYVCANDAGQDSEVRKLCQEKIAKTFQNDGEISARTFIVRRDDMKPEYLDSTYDEIMIKKLESPADARAEIHELKKFYDGIRSEAFSISEEELLMYVYHD